MTGLIHVSEITLGHCVENGGHTSSVCPGSQFSLARSATGAAWPRKALQSGGLPGTAVRAVEPLWAELVLT